MKKLKVRHELTEAKMQYYLLVGEFPVKFNCLRFNFPPDPCQPQVKNEHKNICSKPHKNCNGIKDEGEQHLLVKLTRAAPN